MTESNDQEEDEYEEVEVPPPLYPDLGPVFVLDQLFALNPLVSYLFGAIDISDQAKGKSIGLTTGFKDLDYITGGLQRGDLIVVAGTSSSAKMALYLNIARNVIRTNLDRGEDKQPKESKGKVVLFSLATRKEQITQKLISIDGQLNNHRMNYGSLVGDDWERILSSIGRLGDKSLYIVDRCRIPMSKVQTICQSLKSDYGLDLVIIDYIHLIGSEENPEKFPDISDVALALKAMARELDLPVIVLCPISHNVSGHRQADKRPQLVNMTPVDQYADVVMLMHQRHEPSGEEDDEDDKTEKVLEVVVANNAMGSVGTVLLALDPATGKINTYIDPNYDPF